MSGKIIDKEVTPAFIAQIRRQGCVDKGEYRYILKTDLGYQYVCRAAISELGSSDSISVYQRVFPERKGFPYPKKVGCFSLEHLMRVTDEALHIYTDDMSISAIKEAQMEMTEETLSLLYPMDVLNISILETGELKVRIGTDNLDWESYREVLEEED